MHLRLTTFPAQPLDPVALVRALGLEGEAPVVLLDSAGGSPALARRHYLAWDPVFRLRARRAAVTVVAGAGVLRSAGQEARTLAERAGALASLAPFEALRAATRLAALPVPPAGGPAEGIGAIGGSPAGAAERYPEAEALFGLLSYDAVRYLERLPDTVRDDLGIPDIDVFLPGRLLRYDLASGEAVLLDRLAGDAEAATAEAARVGDALRAARRPSAVVLHGNDLPVYRSTFTRAEY